MALAAKNVACFDLGHVRRSIELDPEQGGKVNAVQPRSGGWVIARAGRIG
jgi:hypothetical protein